MKIIVALALALAAIAIAAYVYRAEPDNLDQRIKAEQMKQASMSRPSPSVVLTINPGQSSSLPRAANVSTRSPMAQEFATARSLKPLYDRLTATGATLSGEGKFLLYKIIATCGKLSGMPTPRAGKDRATQRRELEAMIPESNPDRARRLALFDQMTARCEGLENVAATKADLDKLLADAARDGDAKAQARLAVPPMVNGPRGTQLTISDDQFHALQAAIASRDPEAIAIAGTALSNTYDDAVLRIGPNADELQSRASMEAWRLVACEYGLECGADNLALQQDCINRGQCAASTVQDQVFYYGVSPYEAQLIDQYRQLYRNAVANNDWSGLTLSRQPNTSGSRWIYNTWP
ncbi:MAG TPA: hypothetical protein VMG61_14100 [Usitatibacter sp.]|nr:hypothetical protein [Usitatibacter sp.]